jgi:hypothetical protein
MLASSRAALTEARGDVSAARDLWAEAAPDWRTHGCPVDEAHALLALARCEASLGDAAASRRAAQAARRIAKRLRATPLIAEIEQVARP